MRNLHTYICTKILKTKKKREFVFRLLHGDDSVVPPIIHMYVKEKPKNVLIQGSLQGYIHMYNTYICTYTGDGVCISFPYPYVLYGYITPWV